MNKSKQKFRHVDTYLILFIPTLTGLKFVATKIKWRLKKYVKLIKSQDIADYGKRHQMRLFCSEQFLKGFKGLQTCDLSYSKFK